MGIDGVCNADIFDEYFGTEELAEFNTVIKDIILEDRIPSFQRDHDLIEPGLYQQEYKRNIITYDLRFTKPNTQVIPINAIHTIEHLFATWLKTHKNNLQPVTVSFNPGGCQTMFYLEIFDDYIKQGNHTEKTMLREVFLELSNCIDWCKEQSSVPGATKEECGNYKSHDLFGAQQWLWYYKDILEDQFSKTNF